MLRISFTSSALKLNHATASNFGIEIRPMVDVSDSETRKYRVHVSECVTRK